MDKRNIRSYYLVLIRYVKMILANKRLLTILSSVILRIRIDEIIDVSLACGCINVYTKNDFYKVQFGGRSLELDIYNRSILYEIMPEYMYQYETVKKRPLCVRAPLCIKARISDRHIDEIVGEFRKYGSPVAFDYTRYESLKEGLVFLTKFANGIKAKHMLCQYFDNKHCEYVHEGIVHGDFHGDNILFDKNGKLVLIDFDCLRVQDIQEVDILYYYLQKAAMKYQHRGEWLQVWLYVFLNISQLQKKKVILKYVELDLKLAWIILFIERIGQEKDGCILRSTVMNKIILQIIKCLQECAG